MMIDSLLKVADIILGRRDKLREADKDRRERVSLYFENVSRCLSDIATALREGSEPWKACRELDEYDNKFNPGIWEKKESSIAKVFGKDVAEQIGSELFHLTSVRGGAVAMLSEVRWGHKLHTPENIPPTQYLEESIMKIEQAAGKFKALSVLAATSDA